MQIGAFINAQRDGTNIVTPSSASSSDLLAIQIQGGDLIVRLGWPIVALLVVALIAYFAWKHHFRKRLMPKYSVIKTKLKVAGIGEIEIEPNYANIKIAYQAWVELTTRKIALPFEAEHDVITDVYNSIYEAFGRLRELAKSIPAHQLRDCEDTRLLVETLVKVLNMGLRPHLTIWNSKVRRWYGAALEDAANKGLSPQEIQRKFPGYDALVADLKRLHEEILEYAAFLRKVAEGDHA